MYARRKTEIFIFYFDNLISEDQKFEETNQQIEIFKILEKRGNGWKIWGNGPKIWGNRSINWDF